MANSIPLSAAAPIYDVAKLRSNTTQMLVDFALTDGVAIYGVSAFGRPVAVKVGDVVYMDARLVRAIREMYERIAELEKKLAQPTQQRLDSVETMEPVNAETQLRDAQNALAAATRPPEDK